MAWNSLFLFTAIATNRYIDVARWAGTWMAKHIAHIVLTILIADLLAILTTAMG